MFEEGKLKRYNKAVLHEAEDQKTLSSITQVTGEALEDPLEIHTAHTEHYDSSHTSGRYRSQGLGLENWRYQR